MICQFMREGKVQAPRKIERYWDHDTDVKFLKTQPSEKLYKVSQHRRGSLFICDTSADFLQARSLEYYQSDPKSFRR